MGLAPDAPEEANFLQGLGCQVTYISGRRPEELDPAIPWVKAGRLEVVGGEAVTALRVNGEAYLLTASSCYAMLYRLQTCSLG